MKVLFVVLDWGLGHASRSLTLIRQIRSLGDEVIVASAHEALRFLKRSLPDYRIIEMPSVPVRYGFNGAGLSLAMRTLIQPGLNSTQHKWVASVAEKEGITAIISDNVYGAYAKGIPSVIITHQLNLPLGIVRSMFNRNLEKWLGKFDEVWVPDAADPDMRLTGKLSETKSEFLNVKHIGILSRFRASAICRKAEIHTDPYSYCALISGAEVQRTLFEKEVIEALSGLIGKKAVVLGKTGNEINHYGDESRDTDVWDFASDDELLPILSHSELIICRSGYSSICDLAVLGKRAILVPTPQQPEQLYLAEYYRSRGWYASAKQGTLKDALKRSKIPNGYPFPAQDDPAAEVLSFLRNFRP